MPVLVVGGGGVAARKLASVLESGARPAVVAPRLSAACARIAGRHRIRVFRRRFRSSDLRGKRLVFAATDDLELNTRIRALCEKNGVFCNVAAPAEAGSFQLPASVRRGQFCLAVSTGGASAHLARIWQKKLERLAGPEWGRLVNLLDVRRRRVLAATADPEVRLRALTAIGQPRFARMIRQKGVRAAAVRMDALLAKSLSDAQNSRKSRLFRRALLH